MDQVTPDKIRNVALVGHNGTGKTSLAESLLLTAGAIDRAGRVEDGTTVCDSDPSEHQRHQSLALAVAPFTWRGHKINLIDTPGYADFETEALTALRIADLAVFVVSAVDGVQVQHERLWRAAARQGLPRMVFVNKLDRDNASFQRVLGELRERFGAGIAPLELPIGEEAAFRGVADLLTDTAFVYEAGRRATDAIPDDMETLEHEVHDNLVEGIVVADDALLERYLDGDVPSTEELERTLAIGVDLAQVFPVICGSATGLVAIDRLADFICEIGPSPLDRPPTPVLAGDTTVEIAPDAEGDGLAYVFSSIADPYVGHVSLLKVVTGTVRNDDHLTNVRTGADQRLHGLFTLRGREQLPATAAPAGDIVAVAKLTDTLTGDTLSPKGTPVRVPALELPEPQLAVAIAARSAADEDKLATALHRIVEEDPSLRIERDEDTGQTLVHGTGDTHLQVTLERLERKFGVGVVSEPVRVAYRETITGTAEAEGRYKKQSGGHGQFGVCTLRLAPLERGAGMVFEDEIVGGALPRQFVAAVEKGVIETMAEGGIHGYPVVDVAVTCVDGKFHSVDSSEMSFKMAARLGFRAAMAKAQPVVLEPISRVEVTVPVAYQGEIMGDLNARRGKVQGTELADDGEQTVVALVPTAEILRYAVDLRSMTGGRGTFTARFDHDDLLPPNLLEGVIAP